MEDLEIIAEDLNLEIVYEDADVLVVNKPSGMVVHPAPGHAIRDFSKWFNASLHRSYQALMVYCVQVLFTVLIKIHQAY